MAIIYIDAEVAAIARRIKLLFPNVQQYYTEIPEGFVRPSIYFPKPTNVSSVFSNTRYKKNHTLQVKFFDAKKSDFDAWAAVRTSEDDIMKKRHLIQMIDTNGDLIDNFIRILSIEPRENTENSVNFVLKWNSLYDYEIDIADLMQNLEVNIKVKE